MKREELEKLNELNGKIVVYKSLIKEVKEGETLIIGDGGSYQHCNTNIHDLLDKTEFNNLKTVITNHLEKSLNKLERNFEAINVIHYHPKKEDNEDNKTNI